MGILELIVGIILVVILANLFFKFIPLPGGIAGTIIAILAIILIWRLVF